jgi:hypothetical protein
MQAGPNKLILALYDDHPAQHPVTDRGVVANHPQKAPGSLSVRYPG